ncbi:AlbA family DNA-binding domain-containing protein [Flavobacterium olei]|uniref:AlbA family DNA-binding domain-containing protein n=1 Tax=Flavobacterium olei TaxID=1886782 RepID=UPI003219EF55
MEIHKREDYDIAFIQSLIDNGIEESINIDFKASGSLSKDEMKKKEISKDVSAFANSNGGIIIYGLTEKNHKADSFSFIDGDIFSKEWLEQIISTTIQRNINGLKIFPIRNNGNIKESIYVVQIPESQDAPHINKDKKFYRRYDFQSVVMEEYEIRNLYGRKSKSDLMISQYIISYKEMINEKARFECVIAVQNIGDIEESSYKVNTYFCNYLPKDLSITWNDTEDIKRYNYIHLDNKRVKISANSNCTIYPNETINVTRFYFDIDLQYLNDSFNLMKIELLLFYSGGEHKVKIDFKQVEEFYNKRPLNKI